MPRDHVALTLIRRHFDVVCLLGQCLETYLRVCAPSEESDQPAHLRSLISTFTARTLDSQGRKVFFFHADNKDSDQTGVDSQAVGRKCQKERFLIHLLWEWKNASPLICGFHHFFLDHFPHWNASRCMNRTTMHHAKNSYLIYKWSTVEPQWLEHL